MPLCGTGTSACLALLYAKGELALGEEFIHASIIDTELHRRTVATTKAGAIDAIISEVTGRAWLTGVSQYGVNPDDPFPRWYRLNDTWLR
ncbi:proline racemase family protein [Labrys sp. WJW]|uniref:proline racemase family protein n=1 Tax=Labrys sp. WJW TaxID=1737983 RepID=UPI001FD93804|nr:proline racemase family protein [Labrys sp. WJW]